ncbi:MAG: signal peptidase II [Candidatus Marinimicrobia bacterium]|nr:signal peptidase II [Candidatus Neomarinimicrobiota bacterium]
MIINNKKHLIFAYGWGLALLILDFVVKYFANAYLNFQERTATFLKGLTFYLTHNTGYHYIFGNIENHKLWSMFGLLMLFVLLYSLTKSMIREENPFYKKLYKVILMLTVGAGGNVLEILFTGKATDFFILEPFPWPSNICDQYINGIIYIIMPIMIIKLIIDKFKPSKDNSAETNTDS